MDFSINETGNLFFEEKEYTIEELEAIYKQRKETEAIIEKQITELEINIDISIKNRNADIDTYNEKFNANLKRIESTDLESLEQIIIENEDIKSKLKAYIEKELGLNGTK